MLTEPNPEDENPVLDNEELTRVITELAGAVVATRVQVQQIIETVNINTLAAKQHKEAIQKLSAVVEEMDARLDVIKSYIKEKQ